MVVNKDEIDDDDIYKRNTVVLTIRLRPVERDRLRLLAAELGMSTQEFCIRLLRGSAPDVLGKAKKTKSIDRIRARLKKHEMKRRRKLFEKEQEKKAAEDEKYNVINGGIEYEQRAEESLGPVESSQDEHGQGASEEVDKEA